MTMTRNLHKDAIDVLMLTGDNAQSAEKVARAMAIDLVHAGLSPEAKLKLVERARGRGKGSFVMIRHRTSPRAGRSLGGRGVRWGFRRVRAVPGRLRSPEESISTCPPSPQPPS